MKVVAIIPARAGSQRLKDKNIYPLNGKPLLAYAIEACKHSKYISDVYVSSDGDNILEMASTFGAKTLKRPTDLAEDKIPKIVAVRHAAKIISMEVGHIDVVVVPQANSPQIKAEDIDKGIDMLLEHKLWEVMSTDANGVQNAAFRIVKFDALFNEFLSAHCGFIVAQNIDVHTLDDIKKLEK
jgi:CMP-N-acetylneuraminic acid synthetase